MQKLLALLVALVSLVRCSSTPTPASTPAERDPSAVDFVEERRALYQLGEVTRNPRPLPPGYMRWARDKWEAHGCRFSSDPAKCRLNECDYGVPNCRRDRIMFFRGEARVNAQPAVSGLLRTGLGNRYFAPRARKGVDLVEQLRNDLAVIRPFNGYTDGEHIGLVRRAGRAEWRTYLDDIDFREPPKRVYSRDKDIGLFGVLANLHFGGGRIAFFDSTVDKDADSLDPFVSLSSHAEQALAFAVPEEDGQEGRLIVVSIPEAEIRNGKCGQEMPRPGALLDLYSCEGISKEFKEENEVDAFLYLKPEWILWTHRVTSKD